MNKGDIAFATTDKRRRHLAPVGPSINGVACLARITSQKNAVPLGVVPVPPIAGLTVPSLIEATFLQVETSQIGPPVGTLPQSYLSDFCALVIAITCQSADDELPAHRSFVRHLPPPSMRACGNPRLERTFEILDLNGWRVPRQGDILSFPEPNPQFGGIEALVLSGNDFNTRFQFPAILLLPVAQARIGQPNVALKSGREVRIGPPASLFTFDPSLHWLQKCGRCHTSAWPMSWRTAQGHCLACDGETTEFPFVVDSLPAEPLGAVIHRVRDCLRGPNG